MRDSFVFYRSFADAIAGLPPEEYKKVMQAIIGYAYGATNHGSVKENATSLGGQGTPGA